jgi:hypothetical protein
MPHLIARAKALETTPAMLLTVFSDSGRGVFVFLGSSAAFQQAVPLSNEAQRRDLRDWRSQQFGREIRSLFPVSFHGLGFQLLLCVFAEELIEEHRQLRFISSARWSS